MLCTGCAGTGPAHIQAASVDDKGADTRQFETLRERVLSAVAKSDRRLAKRLGMGSQGVSLLFDENRAPAELSALFEFDRRQKTLEMERAELARVNASGVSGARDALLRFLDEELARVDQERDLPRGASAMVRSLSIDLPVRESREEDQRSEDQALAATLDHLRTSLDGGVAIGPMQLAELDDSLDLLEKRTGALSVTPGAVARFRVALSAAHAAPKEAILPWDVTSGRISRFAGPVPDDLEKRLEEAHARLASALAPTLPREREQRERLLSSAVAMLLASGECPEPGTPGPAGAAMNEPRVRAPVERRGMCALLSALADPSSGNDGVALLAADLALDLGRWSLAVHRSQRSPRDVFASAHAHSVALDELDTAHVFRFAMGHPTEAITLAWAVSLVAVDPMKRSAKWLSYGAIRPDEAMRLLGPPLM